MSFSRRFFRDENSSTESENHAESDDVKILIEFQGSSILENFRKILIAWVAKICVGVISYKMTAKLIQPFRLFWRSFKRSLIRF